MAAMKKARLAVLLSGGGTTLENLFNKIAAGELAASVELVISSKAGAAGLARAQKRQVPTAVVPSCDYRAGGKPDWEKMSAAINEIIAGHEIDLICLAGFMCFYLPPQNFAGRVMNIHPSLIPAFCGHKMYGGRVHQAVAESGVKVTGCTVHFVNDQYDAGPIILQKTCELQGNETAEEIQAKVFKLECALYPEAINLFAAGRLRLTANRVVVV